MPAHATWKGSLNVSLVSVAVKAYAAKISDSGQERVDGGPKMRYAFAISSPF